MDRYPFRRERSRGLGAHASLDAGSDDVVARLQAGLQAEHGAHGSRPDLRALRQPTGPRSGHRRHRLQRAGRDRLLVRSEARRSEPGRTFPPQPHTPDQQPGEQHCPGVEWTLEQEPPSARGLGDAAARQAGASHHAPFPVGAGTVRPMPCSISIRRRPFRCCSRMESNGASSAMPERSIVRCTASL